MFVGRAAALSREAVDVAGRPEAGGAEWSASASLAGCAGWADPEGRVADAGGVRDAGATGVVWPACESAGAEGAVRCGLADGRAGAAAGAREVEAGGATGAACPAWGSAAAGTAAGEPRCGAGAAAAGGAGAAAAGGAGVAGTAGAVRGSAPAACITLQGAN